MRPNASEAIAAMIGVRMFYESHGAREPALAGLDNVTAVLREFAALEAENARMRKALEKYGAHQNVTCEPGEWCSCGLDAALAPPKDSSEDR